MSEYIPSPLLLNLTPKRPCAVPLYSIPWFRCQIPCHCILTVILCVASISDH